MVSLAWPSYKWTIYFNHFSPLVRRLSSYFSNSLINLTFTSSKRNEGWKRTPLNKDWMSKLDNPIADWQCLIQFTNASIELYVDFLVLLDSSKSWRKWKSSLALIPANLGSAKDGLATCSFVDFLITPRSEALDASWEESGWHFF